MANPVWTKNYDPSFAQQELLVGSHFGVFIDDTGSPGMTNSPPKLNTDRKSWVAVIVPPDQVLPVTTAINEMLESLRALGVNECHFVDIYSGKGPFRKELPTELRFVLFQFFADIIYVHELPIYVQTFDPESHAEAIKGWPQLPKIASCFDLHHHEDAALWFLLVRVRDHLLKHRSTGDQRGMVFLDEGLKESGRCVEINVFDDVFLNGHLLFTSSMTAPLLQLADFAAFCLNRTQLIIRKQEKRSDIDIRLLQILEPLAARYKNCTPQLGWPDKNGPMIA